MSEDEIIVGLNPVIEALRAKGRSCRRVFVAMGSARPALDELFALAKASNLRVEKVERSRLDQLYGSPRHQGVAAIMGPYQYRTLEEILDAAVGPQALILILDGVEDPMNLGSLVRSAEAAGAVGVIVPRDRSAPMSAAAIKASAGAAEHLPLTRVVNLVRAMDELKENGFWILGAEAGVGQSLYEVELPSRLALVIGGEGRGLRRLVKEKCDRLISIPLGGRVNSLNAAMAGAVCMFEYVRQAGLKSLNPGK